MEYKRVFFNPRESPTLTRQEALEGNDRTAQQVYVYSERIVLAVNVALAANRPLLVSGPPGSGKSSLAPNIAASLKGWGYAELVITARTQARDLLWKYDVVRRLSDAGSPAVKPDDGRLDPEGYVHKGLLWEAFESGANGIRKVVLLDEMDKADPDVPNSLLVVLGASKFRVEDYEPVRTIEAGEGGTPLVVITTNDERQLSRAFVRRCVSLTLSAPSAQQLVEIADAQGLAGTPTDRDVATRLAAVVERLREDARREGEPVPSAAEYLDALRACLRLEIDPDWSGLGREHSARSDVWRALEAATLRKRLDPDERGSLE